MLARFRPSGFAVVVFDCDGVLADSEPAWAAAERELCRRYGVDRERPPRVSTHGKSMAQTVALLLPGLSPSEWITAEQLLVSIAAEMVPTNVSALPGAVDAVRALSESVPVGVASNSPRVVLEEVLTAIGVAPYVAQLVAGDEVTSGKPAPDVYRRAFTLLGSNASDAVAFEDSLPGIVAARSTGCVVVQVAAPGVPRFEAAHHHVASLDAISRDG